MFASKTPVKAAPSAFFQAMVPEYWPVAMAAVSGAAPVTGAVTRLERSSWVMSAAVVLLAVLLSVGCSQAVIRVKTLKRAKNPVKTRI